MWLLKKNKNANCYVLNNIQNENTFDKVAILDFFETYFRSKHNIDFNYGAYITKEYKDYHKNYRQIKNEILKRESDIIQFIVYDNDSKKPAFNLKVSFIASKINSIVVLVENNIINFNFRAFTADINPLFSVLYGYSYTGIGNKDIDTFEMTDIEVAKYIEGTIKKSRDDLMRWRFNSEKISHGYFRDIYSINILSNSHLDNNINGITVRDIINKKNLGKLELVTDNLYYWTLTEVELKQARNIFYSSTLII